MNSSLAPVARTLLSLIFLVSGARKIIAFAAVSGMMAKRGFPASHVFLTLSILLDFAGGVLLIANWNVRYVAGALAAYAFAAGALFHGFWDSWNASPAEFNNQLNHFLKNLAIIGGLVLLVSPPAAKPVDA